MLMQRQSLFVSFTYALVLTVGYRCFADAQQGMPASAPSAQGSEERVKEKPLVFIDGITKGPVCIMESVLNDQRRVDGNITELKYYMAPLCDLELPDKANPTLSDHGYVFFPARIRMYRDDIPEQALSYLNAILPAKLQVAGKVGPDNLQVFSFKSLSFGFDQQLLPGTTIESLGDLQADVTPSQTEDVLISVPDGSSWPAGWRVDGARNNA